VKTQYPAHNLKVEVVDAVSDFFGAASGLGVVAPAAEERIAAAEERASMQLDKEAARMARQSSQHLGMFVSGRKGGDYFRNSSISAFAVLRSAVSKPSVNRA
jgi:hypothetical protein